MDLGFSKLPIIVQIILPIFRKTEMMKDWSMQINHYKILRIAEYLTSIKHNIM